jgi:hypothetical protein
MASVYYYYVGAPVDINDRVTELDYKISIDLEVPGSDYISTYYNTYTQYVEVSFSTALGYLEINTLNNIITIILYDGVLGTDPYPDDLNIGARRSFKVSSAPGANHDYYSGYSVGSIVITTADEIYICTDNTVTAAVWRQLSYV